MYLCDFCGRPFEQKTGALACELRHVGKRMKFTKKVIGQRALRRFVKEEMQTGRPKEQAVAIAYSRARKGGYNV